MWGYRPGQPVTIEPPLAGQPVEWPVASGLPILIQAVTFELVTSNHVANRIPFVTFTDPLGAVAAATAAPFSLAASKTSLFSFFNGGAQYGANDAALIGGPLPALSVDVRMTLNIGVTLIDAGDQLQNVRLYVVPLGRPYDDEG